MTGRGGIPADALLGIDGFTDAVEVGRGSFGVVYRAHEPAHGRDVAIKVLTLSRDTAATTRFDRERQVLAALSGHPAIVTVIASGYTTSGQPYVVMELMAGGSLGDRVATTGPLLWPQAVDIGIGIAGGLEVAHRMGVLHRDVKPDNLLVNSRGDVKLADFGVATFVGGASSRTWSVIASVAYAAPEVLGGQRSTVASDVYGLGATVFSLLYGRAPFARTSDDSIVPMVTRILNDRPPDLRAHGVPPEVCAVLERAMSRDASARYETAAAFGAALQQAQRDVGRAVTPMVVDANLTALPPHELVTALVQQSSTPPPPPANADLPATPPPLTVPAATAAAAATAATAGPAFASASGGGGGGEPPSPPGPGETPPPAPSGGGFRGGRRKQRDESPWLIARPTGGSAAPGAAGVAAAGAAAGAAGAATGPATTTATGSAAASAAAATAPPTAAGAAPTEPFDAGPVLAEMVTGRGGGGDGRSRRALVAALIGAVLVLGAAAGAVALVRNDDDNGKAATPSSAASTSTDATTTSTEPPTTAPPSTEPPTTAPPTTAPPVTQPPVTQPPVTQATAPPVVVPTVSVTGPTTIEDNVNYVWRSSSSNATSGQWSLSGGPAIDLRSTAWRPGTSFGMRAGCGAVGATYRLALNVTGPGGSNSSSVSFRVVDTNGSCS